MKKIQNQEKDANIELERVLAEVACSHLPLLVARTALWAAKKDYEECLAKGSPAKYPNKKRKKAGQKRGWNDPVKKDFYLDDNSFPNSQMKAALKKRGIEVKHYETCHIWKDSCYEFEYHTCYANLVLLPRALASLSDHNENIRDILKYRAYELFGFYPEGMSAPQKPKNYPKPGEWFTLS